MMKLIIISLVLLCSGCDSRYIVTDRGLLRQLGYYCHIGLVMNTNNINVIGVDGKPVTCSGYVKLTKEEAANWSTE